MIRILWADDQKDVTKTFSGLLSPLAPRIVSVESGTEALTRLRREHFDVLILDLLMPPGEWGGLWLLEKIRQAQIRIAVIVLSGEGTQSETIQALRLGAKDYVTKDKVESELLERVRTMLEEATVEVQQYAITSFPTPLALPYERYLNTTTTTSRLRRLIEFYEASLRFCCIVGICQFESSPRDPVAGLGFIPDLRYPPSMGTWNHMRHALARLLHRECVFFQLHNSFDNKAVDWIIELRNDISHGAEPSTRAAQTHLDNWEPQLQAFVSNLWQHLTLRVVFPMSLFFDGTEFEIGGHELVGASTMLPKLTTRTTEPVICNQPYLLTNGATEQQWINLFPLICVEPAVEPNVWQVLLFDGLEIARNATALTGKEPIRYLDIWSGRRNVVPASTPKSNVLPELLTRSMMNRST